MAISKAMLSCDGTARTSSKRSARRIAGVAALAFLVAATLGSSIVLAGNSVGSFEIDGNLAPDYATPPAEPIDWLSNPFPASLTTFHDVTGQGDNIFGMGPKENDQSSWVFQTGNAPQKDDVLDQISILQSFSPVVLLRAHAKDVVALTSNIVERGERGREGIAQPIDRLGGRGGVIRSQIAVDLEAANAVAGQDDRAPQGGSDEEGQRGHAGDTARSVS